MYLLLFSSFRALLFGLEVLIKGLFYILSQVADLLQIIKLIYFLGPDA
jgi:hypothetical protein